MTIQINKVQRAFVFNGVSLNDPGPDFSADEVRDIYTAQYPDLATAVVSDPVIEGDTVTYTFVRNVGTKGSGGLTKRALAKILSNTASDTKKPVAVFNETPGIGRCLEAVEKLFQRPSRSSKFLRVDPKYLPPVF